MYRAAERRDVQQTARPTAWTHSAVLTVLSVGDGGTVEHEEEVVEILAMDDADVVADLACVVRISDLPPCLGRFWSAQ